MKRLIIPAPLCLASCSSKTVQTEPSTPHSDTSKTVALYATPAPQHYLMVDYVYKIVRDTFALVFDSTKNVYVKKWVKDSVYFAPTPVPLLDSLRKPKLDSLKRPLYTTEYTPLPANFIVKDFNKRF